MNIKYVVEKNEDTAEFPYTVFSEVMTRFGSKPARNFVSNCNSEEEAKKLIRRLESV